MPFSALPYATILSRVPSLSHPLSFLLLSIFFIHKSVIGGLRRRLQVANKKIALQDTAVDEG